MKLSVGLIFLGCLVLAAAITAPGEEDLQSLLTELEDLGDGLEELQEEGLEKRSSTWRDCYNGCLCSTGRNNVGTCSARCRHLKREEVQKRYEVHSPFMDCYNKCLCSTYIDTGRRNTDVCGSRCRHLKREEVEEMLPEVEDLEAEAEELQLEQMEMRDSDLLAELEDLEAEAEELQEEGMD